MYKSGLKKNTNEYLAKIGFGLRKEFISDVHRI